MGKSTSFGSSVKQKRLSDITNLHSYRISPAKCDVSPEFDSVTRMHIDRLLEENITLMKQLQEKNELVELRGMELRNLRVSVQRIQLQNWQLAQTNTHMLAELNLSKEKMRALQHEIACKDALLKAKSLELQLMEMAREVECVEEAHHTLQPNDDTKKDSDERRTIRRQSTMASTTQQTDKTKEMAQNKRCGSRRRSSRSKVKSHEIKEDDLFEIDVANFPLCRSQRLMKDHLRAETSSDLSDSRIENADHSPTLVASNGRRSSVGRPVRRAALRVESYKEAPLNVKMRRAE